MMTVRPFGHTLDRMMTLNRELDRVLGQGPTAAFWVPALDVVEKTDGYLIALDLPGVKPEQVEISFERNTLAIRGTKAPTFETAESEELRVYSAERVNGSFERAVRLPEYVDGDRIAASFEHGVLTISVPKSQAALPRKIAIRQQKGTAST